MMVSERNLLFQRLMFRSMFNFRSVISPTWMFPKIGVFTPKWMVKIMVQNPMNKWDDLGGVFPLFSEASIYIKQTSLTVCSYPRHRHFGRRSRRISCRFSTAAVAGQGCVVITYRKKSAHLH